MLVPLILFTSIMVLVIHGVPSLPEVFDYKVLNAVSVPKDSLHSWPNLSFRKTPYRKRQEGFTGVTNNARPDSLRPVVGRLLGVLIAYNKDTSEYWDQTIEYDPVRYHFLLNRATRVLMNEAQKVAKDSSDWRCKDCSKKDVCWNDAPVPMDMRTCAHAVPASGGWNCTKGCVGVCNEWERYKPKDKT